MRRTEERPKESTRDKKHKGRSVPGGGIGVFPKTVNTVTQRDRERRVDGCFGFYGNKKKN